MIKIGFVSLGCSKNLVDTEVMLRILHDKGYELTPDEAEAEVIVINTCGFIESAKQESIDTIIELSNLKTDGKCKYLVATGCLVERYREEVMKELPELDAILGVGSIKNIADAIDALYQGHKYISFEDKEASELGGERILTTEEHTAYLKIAEGCDNRCSYCAIPAIRGKFRSRSIEDIVSEAKDLEALGVKEISLIAQDTSRYGLDLYGKYSLAELVRRICSETKIPWIRLLYCYPDKITDELIAELRDNPRLLKYIDIPIQHISDKVLGLMNRHGGESLIRQTVAKLRREVPGIVLRTTAMVGFPGEDEEDFCRLCEFVKEARFEHFGAFAYSAEEGTAAYSISEGIIDEQTKQDRYDILMQTQLTVVEEFNEAEIGKKLTVLCDGYDTVAEIYYGRSYKDAPDVDGRVYFKSRRRIRAGEFVTVKVLEACDYDLVGEAIFS